MEIPSNKTDVFESESGISYFKKGSAIEIKTDAIR
jgi:hypothetical protein